VIVAQLSQSTWTQIIVGISIFLPVIVTVWITIVVLRGKKDDPDEQRWRRLAEQRRESEKH
jgi:heme/copper-type cytochrome/quinol oxidase subunit 2